MTLKSSALMNWPILFCSMALAGSSVNATDWRLAQLIEAVKNDDRAEVKKQINAHVDVNDADERGDTPLYWAIVFNRKPIFDILIAAGAEYRTSDKLRQTVLYTAAKWGRANMCNVLLEGVCRKNAIDVFGKTPLHYAVAGSSKNSAEYIRTIISLLNAGVPIDGHNNDQTPLTLAVTLEKMEIASLLLARGANPNVACPVTGRTPLMLAAQQRNRALVELLLKNGANKEAEDFSGRTVLGYLDQNTLAFLEGAYFDDANLLGAGLIEASTIGAIGLAEGSIHE